MTATAENLPTLIETIPQAAAELSRLHRTLGAQAVELTQGYLATRLAGDEGITWRRGTHLISGKVTIPDPVIRIGYDVEIAAQFLPLNERAARFRFTDTGSANGDSFTVERREYTDAAREKYWIIGNEVLRAMRTHSEAPYEPIDPADATTFAQITQLISDIRPYETATAEPAEN